VQQRVTLRSTYGSAQTIRDQDAIVLIHTKLCTGAYSHER
jgi:hypothetical protein